MSFNISNYMDGVPVKISERYKPPPKVSIPQAVLNRLSTITEDHYESSQYTYSFQLEKQVIKKLAEWQKVREAERENRRERIRKYEMQKCRDIEAKQKQLLTAVSYPSADDLSSDDNDNAEEDKVAVKPEVVTPPAERVNHHPQQSFDTILQPILANSYTTHSPSTVFNPSKINYSDFESDTASPFELIELKTINDLDILAQVLNDTQKHSVEHNSGGETVHQKAEVEEQPPTIVNSAATTVAAVQPATNEVEVPAATTSSTPNQSANFYYTTNVIPNNYQMMVHQTQALHLQQQHQQQYMMNYANMNHHNIKQPSTANLYFNYNGLPASSNHNYLYSDYSQQAEAVAMSTTVNHNAKYVYSNGTYVNNYCDSPYGVHSVDVVAAGTRLQPEIIPKSKSKSVPDILKELKDEIRDSEIRRTRNHSQTIDDQAKRNSADSAQSISSPSPTSRSSSSSSTSFLKLSPSSQTLAKNISSMGFPLERVSKIAELYGNDDKKIVEHLIPLSELLDLGFDESKISEALFKFDNNKDKALDFLIS